MSSSSPNNITNGLVAEDVIGLSFTDDSNTIVASFTDNDGKDMVEVATVIQCGCIIAPILKKKIITKNTAFNTLLPLAKDGKDVEVSTTGLGSNTNCLTFSFFIPNYSHIPLESEIYLMRLIANKIQVETDINGERTIFPYMTHIDRRAFYEVLLKKEEEEGIKEK